MNLLTQRVLRGAVAAIALYTLRLAASEPAAPEPNVAATIEKSVTQPGSCLVVAEVRDPKSNDLLFAPKVAVAEGQEARAKISDPDRKVELTVKAGPGCATGTYLVNVWTGEKLAYSKSGALEPKAP